MNTSPLPKQTPWAKRGFAFTLIELLVVVVIIAVLAALLMPALSGVMENAHRTKCMSNQRQIVMAMISYAADTNGYLPYPNWGNRKGETGWLYDPTDMTLPEHLERGLIWKYVRHREIYRCPLDNPPKQELNKRAQRISSYCVNGAICGYKKPTAAPPENTYRISQFPGNAFMLWEQEGGAEGMWFNDASNHPNQALSDRHKGGCVLTCFDGHSEFLRWDEYFPMLDSLPGRLWCSPGTQNGK